MKFCRREGCLIEAEPFDPDADQWPSCVEPDGKGGYTVYNDLHKGDIRVQPGDWIRIDNPGDIYPIHPDLMEQNYRPYEEPTDES